MVDKTSVPGANFEYLYFDFDGVMTDDSVLIDQLGQEYVTCSRLDGSGVALITKANKLNLLNLEMAIISSESNPVVKARAEKLQIPCFQGVSNKFEFLSYGGSLGHKPTSIFDFTKLIYLGNDLNDLDVMAASGLSIAPSNAHAEIKKISSIVFPESGGKGFVRAAIEWILGTENLSKIIRSN